MKDYVKLNRGLAGLVAAVLLLMTGCAQGATQTTPPATLAPEATDVAAVTTAPPTAVPPAPADSPVAVFPGGWVTPVPWPEGAVTAGSVVVDAGEALGRVNPFLFGSNYGPWLSVPLDLMDQATSSGITLLRWPGGEWGDRNDITEKQLDQYMDLVGAMDAEPLITVRLLNGTPEAAAELVRYANIENDYHVTYWAIGNEPNLYPEGQDDPDTFNANWRAIAEAMLAVDPDIVLMGPEITSYLPASLANDDNARESRALMDSFLRANGDLVDIVTIHHYPFPQSVTASPPTVGQLAASVEMWEPMIAELRESIRETTGGDLPVGVTEFNANWSKQSGSEATPDSIAGAVWLADVLGRLIRLRADVATQFALQSTANHGAWGLFSRTEARPQYYVYPLFDMFGTELVYAAVGDEQGAEHPTVTAYAALGEGGALTLMVINRGEEAVTMPLSLDGHSGGTAEVYRLIETSAADGTAAQPVESIDLADGAALLLPPLSVNLYIIPGP